MRDPKVKAISHPEDSLCGRTWLTNHEHYGSIHPSLGTSQRKSCDAYLVLH